MESISEYFRHKLSEQYHQEYLLELREKRANTRVWPVWHRACGDIAFFMTHDPRIGTVKSENCRLFNGRRPQPNSVMVCESCQQAIEEFDLLAEMPPRRIQIVRG